MHAVEHAVLAATDLLPRGATVLVACSGGPDSVALTAACARQARVLGICATVGHVDHALRPGSAQEAEQVARVAAVLGLPFHCARIQVDAAGRGLEAAAREGRYAALVQLAREAGASRVATAHTRRDQAETVLLRLARGGGPSALTGIRRSRPLADGIVLVRPLLSVPRSATEAYCARLGLPALLDPHNRDPRRTRTRVRDLFPQLAAALNPRLEEALAGAAQLAADEDALLDAQARAALAAARVEDGFRADALAGLPRALARRALLLAAAGAAEPERAHLERLLDALPRDTRLDLPGGRATVRDGILRFERPPAGLPPVQITGPGRYRWADRLLRVGEGANQVDLQRAPLPWTLRTRLPGDRLREPSGRDRKVADLWSAARVPLRRRERMAVLADARGTVFWAEGAREGAASAGLLLAPVRFDFGPEMDGLR